MWQLIDTAPKDGTRVLLFCPEQERKQCLGYYINYESFSYGVSVDIRQGWVVEGSSIGSATPSHWQLLTDPE